MHGDYGLIQDCKVRLINTNSKPAMVEARFTASQNYTAAAVMIDGKLFSIGPVAKGKSKVFWSSKLEGGGSRVLQLQTMAVNGGYYPAEIEFSFPECGSESQ